VHQHEVGGLDHLARRMDERGLDVADVLRCCAVGRICVFPPRGPDYVGGGFLANDMLVYCQALVPPGSGDFSHAIPSISTAWRLSPIEQRMALAAPVCELARPGEVHAAVC
jgi:hypothetical protein